MYGDKSTRRNLTKLYERGNLRVRFGDHTFCYGVATAPKMEMKHQTGRLQMRSRTVLALSFAIVLGAVSAQAASDHEDQSGGSKIGPQGQHFGSGPSAAYEPARQAFASGKKPRHVNAASASASAPSQSPMDALFVQHKDKGWDHIHQSWCDVDPACNGWNEKMKAVEGNK